VSGDKGNWWLYRRTVRRHRLTVWRCRSCGKEEPSGLIDKLCMKCWDAITPIK